MTDHVLRTARPPNVAIAWATKDAIFVEVPSANGGAPFIVRERRSLAGLAKALNILVEHAEAPLVRHESLNNGHTEIKKIEPAKAKATTTWASDQQRERTREILRKMGKI